MVMRKKPPDALKELIKRRSVGVVLQEEKVHLKKVRSLRKYRPCINKLPSLRKYNWIEGHLTKSPDVSV